MASDEVLSGRWLIHEWKRAPLEGWSGVFERGGRKKPEIDEEQVRELHAKIGELAVANSFWKEMSGRFEG